MTPIFNTMLEKAIDNRPSPPFQVLFLGLTDNDVPELVEVADCLRDYFKDSWKVTALVFPPCDFDARTFFQKTRGHDVDIVQDDNRRKPFTGGRADQSIRVILCHRPPVIEKLETNFAIYCDGWDNPDISADDLGMAKNGIVRVRSIPHTPKGGNTFLLLKAHDDHLYFQQRATTTNPYQEAGTSERA